MSAADYFNATEHDEDPLSELDETPNSLNKTNLYYNESAGMVYIKVMGHLMFFAFIASVIAQIFLLVVLFKFKKLRTRTNLYILNLTICNLIHWTLLAFHFLSGTSIIVYCLFNNLSGTCFMLHLIFAFLLAVDWFLSVSESRLTSIYGKHIKALFILIYVMFGMQFLLHTFLCISSYVFIELSNILSVCYLLFLIVLITFNVFYRKYYKTKSDGLNLTYALNTSNIIFSFIFPIVVYHFIFKYFMYSVTLLVWFGYISMPLYLIMQLTPVAVIYQLGRQNKHFKMAYDKIFKRSVREYDDAILDDAGSDCEDEGNTSICNSFVNGMVRASYQRDKELAIV